MSYVSKMCEVAPTILVKSGLAKMVGDASFRESRTDVYAREDLWVDDVRAKVKYYSDVYVRKTSVHLRMQTVLARCKV